MAKRLLGKDESAMSTILNGTNMLSTVIRRDEFYRNLLRNSEDIAVARKARIDTLMKEGMSYEEASAKAPIQTFFNTEKELIEATGAQTGDYRRIGTISQRGEEGLEQINPLTDRSKQDLVLMKHIYYQKLFQLRIFYETLFSFLVMQIRGQECPKVMVMKLKNLGVVCNQQVIFFLNQMKDLLVGSLS